MGCLDIRAHCCAGACRLSRAQKAESHGGNRGSLQSVGTGQSSNGSNDTPSRVGGVGPQVCSRWDRCSAPICPLDPDWRLRKHLENEPVCGLLLELAKPAGEATLRACVRAEVAQAAITLAPTILGAVGMVRRACERSAKSGSRMRNLRREVAA